MAPGNVKVELNFHNLAKATEGVVTQYTDAIAGRAGEGYMGDVIWTDRPHGAVRATTYKARVDNAKHNTLLKAVHG